MYMKSVDIWLALTHKNRQLFVLFDKTTPKIASTFLLIARRALLFDLPGCRTYKRYTRIFSVR